MKFLAILALASSALAGPMLQREKRAGDAVPGTFIVKFKNDDTLLGKLGSSFLSSLSLGKGEAWNEEAWGSILSTVAPGLDITPDRLYQLGASFRGFSAQLDSKTVKTLQDLDLIDYVAQDSVVSIFENKPSTSRRTRLAQKPKSSNGTNVIKQSDNPWGLGRISSRTPATNNGTQSYVYDSSAGEGTCVYIIDTGIFSKHEDFEGRATALANFSVDDSPEDGNGHGTHVAGTVGSRTFGVAKKSTLLGVKVLAASGFGTVSNVIAGIDFVTSDAAKRTKNGDCPNGFVANMSLGGPKNEVVNEAIRALINAGIFVVAASGNESQDAINTSPGSEEAAFIVSATDKNDKIAPFSNFGKSVDIFAPGVDILSTWIESSSPIGAPLTPGAKSAVSKKARSSGPTNVISGTSMASPHVAGLAAYLFGLKGAMTPDEARKAILDLATPNVVKGLKSDTVNLFAFNGSE